MDEEPYKAEYAKSNRSGCKVCGGNIAMGDLRIARMIQSSHFDGKVPVWHHSSCFFKKFKPAAVGDIAKFDGLRIEDQKMIKDKLMSSSVEDEPKGKGKKKKTATKRKSEVDRNFKIEYAASNRSVCIGCEQKIVIDDVRCAKIDFDSEKGARFGGIPRWYHLTCFAQCRPDTEFWDSGEILPGYDTLKAADKKQVKEILPKMAPVKKEEANDGVPTKRAKLDEQAYDQQAKDIYNLKDKLMTLSKANIGHLLEENGISIPVGKDRMLDAVTDAMLFGVPEKCPECKKGCLYYRNRMYNCDAQDEWTRCEYKTKDPQRKVFKIPKFLQKKEEFLAEFKCQVKKRLIEELERSTSVSGFKTTIKVDRPKPPLERMQFVLQGTLSKSTKEIKKDVVRLGGAVITKMTPDTVALICDQASVKKGTGKKLEEAEQLEVHVIPEEFLEKVKPLMKQEEVFALIKTLAMTKWGGEIKDRLLPEVTEEEKSALKSKSMYSSKGESKVTVQLKGGAYVDPQSGLEKKTHVYKEGNDLYTSVLSRTDIQRGSNSYYKLQVLESDGNKKWWVFRAWGRIGTTIGNKKLEEFDSPEDAVENFCQVFKEQTATDWHKRANFKKQPGKYFLMDIDYGADKKDQLVSFDDCKMTSKLDKPVQDLIKLIFDVKAMEQAMLEFELDLEKMPLGKLSEKQIRSAFTELSQLQNLVHDVKMPSRPQIVAATNRFYTLIPHCAGVEVLPMLDNEEIIKEKLTMLESLLEMEVAYSLLKQEEGADDKVHPIDSQYDKLKTTITVLDKDSEEFGHLQAYVRNTHAETHDQYELDIAEVFKVQRHGENKRYKPFQKLPNRKLLWHGSRLTNFPGILSQGLRIAPPEAPVTGYMFGKGIYFADMVSKSANYCFTSRTRNTGLMLLCEVALGEMVERTQADYIQGLPKGKHSVKGIGITHPDPEHSVKLPQGVEIPLGPAKKMDSVKSSLLYNEYIVYDSSQVKIEYLLKMNFKYKN